MKVKFGTVLNETVYDELKMSAARERRPMSEIVQNALTHYLHQARPGPARRTAFDRLLERDPLTLTSEQLRQSMEEDFFDQ